MDKKRQAHLNHIEEDIFDRPPSTNLKMWIMQIILNAIIGTSSTYITDNLD